MRLFRGLRERLRATQNPELHILLEPNSSPIVVLEQATLGHDFHLIDGNFCPTGEGLCESPERRGSIKVKRGGRVSNVLNLDMD